MKSPKFGIYNLTLEKFVRDADSDDLSVFETECLLTAEQALDKVRDVASINPNARHHEFEIQVRP